MKLSIATPTSRRPAQGPTRCPQRALSGVRRSVVRRFKEAPERKDTQGSEVLDQTRDRVRQIKGNPAKASTGYAVMGQKQNLREWVNNLGALEPDQVDIQVTHNGVCHSDLHMRDDDWGISKFPFIPGHEVVGLISAVGSQVQGLEVGQRVGVGWIKSSCRRCNACLRGEENICDEGYTGLIVAGGNGGFQSTLRAPADFCYHIPDGLDSADAAPLLCAGITVFAPLRRYQTRPGMSVAVLGIGGLGHLGLQYAKALGGIVTAIDISPDKEGEARSLGATQFINFRDEGQVAAAKGKFDVLLNCASARISTATLLSMLRNDGTLVQVGIPGGAEMSLPLQDLVFGQKKVVGSIVGGRADMDTMLKLSAAEGIKPMIELMPLSKVNEALERVAKGLPRYRVVLVSDENDPVLKTAQH